jgi:hypothetical protein
MPGCQPVPKWPPLQDRPSEAEYAGGACPNRGVAGAMTSGRPATQLVRAGVLAMRPDVPFAAPLTIVTCRRTASADRSQQIPGFTGASRHLAGTRLWSTQSTDYTPARSKKSGG